MDEYIIEKVDGKFICTNDHNQKVTDLITILPINNVQFDQNFAYLKYNDYMLFISRQRSVDFISIPGLAGVRRQSKLVLAHRGYTTQASYALIG